MYYEITVLKNTIHLFSLLKAKMIIKMVFFNNDSVVLVCIDTSKLGKRYIIISFAFNISVTYKNLPGLPFRLFPKINEMK